MKLFGDDINCCGCDKKKLVIFDGGTELLPPAFVAPDGPVVIPHSSGVPLIIPIGKFGFMPIGKLPNDPFICDKIGRELPPLADA